MAVIYKKLEYRSPLIKLDLDRVNYIVLHHPEWLIASVEDIHEDVLKDPKKKDWSGFPYGEYIRKDGTVYIVRGDSIGAQCQGYNSTSYGICCEGNYDVETEMPEPQFKALQERIKFHIPRFKNFRCVVPHNKLYNTTCPGRYFPMARILNVEVKPMTIDEALKIQVDEGVINSPDYWRKVVETTKNMDLYVISNAKKIQVLKAKIQELKGV